MAPRLPAEMPQCLNCGRDDPEVDHNMDWCIRYLQADLEEAWSVLRSVARIKMTKIERTLSETRPDRTLIEIPNDVIREARRIVDE